MDIIKEFVKNKAYGKIRVIIRTNTYCNDMSHLNMLADAQKADFPSVTEQEAIVYGGRSYKGTMGVEGKIDIDSDMPHEYFERKDVELKR